MSLYELGDSSRKVSLKGFVCKENSKCEVALRNIANYIVRGRFPGAVGLPVEN